LFKFPNQLWLAVLIYLLILRQTAQPTGNVYLSYLIPSILYCFGRTQEMLVTKFLSPADRLVLRGTERLPSCDFTKFVLNSAPNAMHLEDFTVQSAQKLLSKQI
jgi:hypothetical protein